MDKYNLTHKWDLWYHSLHITKWDIQSYNNLFKLQNLYDYKILQDTFIPFYYQNGMFFLMKHPMKPIWEDPHNRLGGCLSYKVLYNNIKETWDFLIQNCISENIFNNDNINQTINGLSISPKKEFNIIKIWFNCDLSKEFPNYKNDFITNKFLDIHKFIYRQHIDS